VRNSFDEGRGKASEFLQGEFIRTDDQSCRYKRQARVLHLELRPRIRRFYRFVLCNKILGLSTVDRQGHS
jgi:hypothetical protein